MNQRHTEFFGPDLGRGPFSSQKIETSALQIATALAQVRAPVSRSDDDIRAHIDFIRELADRLAPDYATLFLMSVSPQAGFNIQTNVRTGLNAYSLCECWLADSAGAGPTSVSPTSVTWNTGTIVQTVAANRHFRVMTPATGVLDMTVQYSGSRSWYWAITRGGRVYYSSRLQFI